MSKHSQSEMLTKRKRDLEKDIQLYFYWADSRLLKRIFREIVRLARKQVKQARLWNTSIRCVDPKELTNFNPEDRIKVIGFIKVLSLLINTDEAYLDKQREELGYGLLESRPSSQEEYENWEDIQPEAEIIVGARTILVSTLRPGINLENRLPVGGKKLLNLDLGIGSNFIYKLEHLQSLSGLKFPILYSIFYLG